MSAKAMKQALEAICGSGDFLFNWHDCELNNEREMQAYQAVLAANEKAFAALRAAIVAAGKQVANSKPLTRSQINEASREAQVAFCLDKQPTYEVALARAVEAKHGITGGAK